jgi:hypothetical protein
VHSMQLRERYYSQEQEQEKGKSPTFDMPDMCCLVVLDSVPSTPQWIRQPKPRVFLKQGACLPRPFRGNGNNDMKK